MVNEENFLDKVGVDYSEIRSEKIIHIGVIKSCEKWGLKQTGNVFKDGDEKRYGVVAYEVQDNFKKKYALFVIPSFIYTGGACKSLNKSIIDYCAKKDMGVFVYVIEGDYFYKLIPKIIQEQYHNCLGFYNGQITYDLVNFQKVGAENMNLLRKIKQNKPEKLLTNLFRNNELPIFYTGSGEQQFYVSNKRPDWKVEGQNKIIEYCGKYWHTKEEIDERKKLFTLNGYKTLIIWEGEENDIQKLLNKVKEFIDKNDKEN